MDSLILRTGVRLLLPAMLLFSAFIFWRGHNDPGGGFVGGLICAVGFALHAMAFGIARMRRVLVLDPRSILGLGLLVAVVLGLITAPTGSPYMSAEWWVSYNPDGSKALALGTPVLFDLGVYLVVVGSVLAMVQSLMEEG